MSMASDLWQEHFDSIIVWKTKCTSWGPEFSHRKCLAHIARTDH